MDFRIRPLADRVVIKPQEREEKTKGGLFLPDTASKEKPQEGLVMAIGEGRLDDSGKRIPVSVQNGDRVLFAKYAEDGNQAGRRRLPDPGGEGHSGGCAGLKLTTRYVFFLRSIWQSR